MAGTGHGLPVPSLAGARVLIVEARYHAAINDLLLAGTKATLQEGRVRIDHVVVPGALEIPPAIAMADQRGLFDGYVALGCVIRGETTHYDLVANESARGITDLGVGRGIAIGNGILTVENEAQALERADPHRQDKGGHAALAALVLMDWRRMLAAR